MTDLLARNAERWAALTATERKRIIQAHAYHFAVYAEAIGFRIANPPRPEPTAAAGFGSINSLPDPKPGGIYE